MKENPEAIFDEGFEHFNKGDIKTAVGCFRTAGEQGFQEAIRSLLGIYELPDYDITPEHFIKEVEYFANLGNFYAMLYLGRIRVGSYDTLQPKPSFGSYDFSKEVGAVEDNGIKWVDKAVGGLEKICTDRGLDSFEGLDFLYCDAVFAYNKWERLLRNQPDSNKNLEAIEKACACIDQSIRWAKKYLPNTQDKLDYFIELEKTFKGSLNNMREMRDMWESMREVAFLAGDGKNQFMELMTKFYELLKKHTPAKSQNDIEMIKKAMNYAKEASQLDGVPSDLVQKAKEYFKNCEEMIKAANLRFALEKIEESDKEKRRKDEEKRKREEEQKKINEQRRIQDEEKRRKDEEQKRIDLERRMKENKDRNNKIKYLRAIGAIASFVFPLIGVAACFSHLYNTATNPHGGLFATGDTAGAFVLLGIIIAIGVGIKKMTNKKADSL